MTRMGIGKTKKDEVCTSGKVRNAHQMHVLQGASRRLVHPGKFKPTRTCSMSQEMETVQAPSTTVFPVRVSSRLWICPLPPSFLFLHSEKKNQNIQRGSIMKMLFCVCGQDKMVCTFLACIYIVYAFVKATNGQLYHKGKSENLWTYVNVMWCDSPPNSKGQDQLWLSSRRERDKSGAIWRQNSGVNLALFFDTWYWLIEPHTCRNQLISGQFPTW